MALTDIVLGVATVASTIGGSAMYGVTDARGTPLPHREYVWPATELAALYLGSKVPLPDNGPSKKFGVGVGLAAAALGAVSYGLGYLVGHISN